METNYNHAGAWLEELRPGQEIPLPDLDCSEERIMSHARLFGAFHPVNTDRDYARQSGFGRPIAHGPFGPAQCLAAIGNALGPSLVAMTKIGEWRFLGPAFMDDVCSASATVIGIERQAARGLVEFEFRVRDPEGRLIQRGEATIIVRRRQSN